MVPIPPSRDEVYGRVDQALSQLLERDRYLLEIDANERAISHRLALYLEALFEGWHVDCEYNRRLDGPKRLEYYEPLLQADQRNRTISETDAITVFPDIIVHERGFSNNLLIIEMKKTTSKVSSDFDLAKLSEFKSQYGYLHALFLKLVTGRGNQVGVEVKQYLPD